MSPGREQWQRVRQWLMQAGEWMRTRPLLVDSLLAVAVAIPFAGWSLSFVLDATHLPWSLALALVVIVLHASLAFRRISPARSFFAMSASSLALVLIPAVPAIPPSLVAFPLSLYAYSAYGDRKAPALGLAVAVTGAGVLTAQWVLSGQAAATDFAPIVLLGTLLAIALAAWSLGLFRRIQLAYVAALEDRAARAEAEREERARRAVLDERTRIAREMHDVVAHSLAVIVSQAQGGQYAARTNPEQAATVLATIATTGRQALADMRGLLGVLRTDTPAGATTEEVGWGPQPTLSELPEMLDRVRAAGLSVEYTTTGQPHALGLAAELALYRVVQEALTNTLKHAGPGAHATIQFTWAGDGLTLTLCDTGRGPTHIDGNGHGLIGMRERLAIVGGSVTAGPAPDGGFVVRAWIPHRAESANADTSAEVHI